MAQILNTINFTAPISPPDTTTLWGSHYSKYGIGGLQEYESLAQLNSIPITRLLTGSLGYAKTEDAYYMWSNSAWRKLPGLTPGSPTFPGFTSSAGILVTDGHIHVSTTNGTMSAPQITASTGFSGIGANIISINADNISSGTLAVARGGTGQSSWTQYGLVYASAAGTLGQLTDVTAGKVLVNSAGAPVWSNNLWLNNGNIQTSGTASFGATTVSSLKVTDITTNKVPYYNGTKLVDSYLTQGAGTLTCGSGFTASSIRSAFNLQVIGMSNLAGLTSSAGINISSGNLGFSTTNTISVIDGAFVLDGDSSGALQIQSGLVWLGNKSDGGEYASLTQSAGKLVSVNGFQNSNATFTVNGNGDLQCNSLKQTSLRSLKHDIINIPDPQLDNIMKLRPVTFLYNDDAPQDINDVKVRQAGFIAEQVQQIYPQIAWYKDGQLAGLQYQRLTAYLVKAVQQLNIQVKSLRAQLDAKS